MEAPAQIQRGTGFLSTGVWRRAGPEGEPGFTGATAWDGSVRLFAEVGVPVYQNVNGNQITTRTYFKPVAGSPEFTDVEIQVEQGRRAVVRRILFNGSRHVPRLVLLKAMTQKQSSWLSWFNSAGVYEPGNLLADTMAIVSSLDPVMGGIDK